LFWETNPLRLIVLFTLRFRKAIAITNLRGHTKSDRVLWAAADPDHGAIGDNADPLSFQPEIVIF
jgi:hypothetical protein